MRGPARYDLLDPAGPPLGTPFGLMLRESRTFGVCERVGGLCN